MSTLDDTTTRRIVEFCRQLGVVRLDLVGSRAIANHDPAQSDFDFFVDFGERPRSGLDDPYFTLLALLEDLLERPVDLIEATQVRNRVVLASLEASRVPIYAAA